MRTIFGGTPPPLPIPLRHQPLLSCPAPTLNTHMPTALLYYSFLIKYISNITPSMHSKDVMESMLLKGLRT